MLTFVIFSYNRAMQLDALLRSLFRHCEIQVHVVVLYRCTDDFKGGYELLKTRWNQVEFREERALSEGERRPAFPWTFANLKRFVRYKYLRQVKSDFRPLLIDVLRRGSGEHVAFLTDDSIFVEPFGLPPTVAERISAAPREVSFSFRLGTNISLLNSYEAFDPDTIRWDYDDQSNHKDWRYYFSVDGHVYAKESLIQLCERVLFCNPNSFEAFVFDYVRRHHWFRKGFAYRRSKLLSFPVNIVQNTQENESLSLSLEFLEQKFLDGWHLQYPYPGNAAAFQNYPDHVRLCKDGESDLIVKTSQEM